MTTVWFLVLLYNGVAVSDMESREACVQAAVTVPIRAHCVNRKTGEVVKVR